MFVMCYVGDEMRRKVEPQERRRRAYALTQRLREQGTETAEAQAWAIEEYYGGWTAADKILPTDINPVRCPACHEIHDAKYNCKEKRDAYWAMLRDKEMPPPLKEYARAALGLGDSQDKVEVMFVNGGQVPNIPCATCGAAPVGVFGDGSPRYAETCSHPPIYPEI